MKIKTYMYLHIFNHIRHISLNFNNLKFHKSYMSYMVNTFLKGYIKYI